MPLPAAPTAWQAGTPMSTGDLLGAGGEGSSGKAAGGRAPGWQGWMGGREGGAREPPGLGSPLGRSAR